MKKIFLIIIIIQVVSFMKTYAQDKDQSKFYIKVFGGYSLATPGSDVQPAFYGSNNENYVSPLAGGTFTGSRLGAGAGFNYGAGIIVPINQSWMIGIDVNNLSGQKRKYTQTDSVFDKNTSINTATTSVLSVIPNITYKVFTSPTYFIYTKLGAIVAVNTKNSFYSAYAFNDQSEDNGTDKLKYGVNLGMQAALGVQYKIGSNLSIFGEFTGNFLSVKAKSGVDQQIAYNAEHNVTTISTSNTTYLKSNDGRTASTITTTTANGVSTINETTTASPTLEHINSVVLNVGVVYGFK